MGFGRGMILIALAILLMISLTFFTFGIGTNTLLYQEVYQNAISEDIVSDLIKKQTTSNAFDFQLVSEEQISQSIDQNIENFLSYLRDDTDELILTMQINSAALTELSEESVGKLPICQNPSQSPDISDLAKITCRPTSISVSQFTEDILQENGFDASQNTFDLVPLFEENGNPAQFKLFVTWLKFSLYISLVLAVLISFLIFFVNIFNVKKSLRWISLPIFIVAAILLTLSIVSINFLPNLWTANPGNATIVSMLQALTSPVLIKIKLVSTILLGIGVAVFISSFFFSHNEKN